MNRRPFSWTEHPLDKLNKAKENFIAMKNSMEWHSIKEKVNKALPDFKLSLLRPYLWKDQIGDVFILTKNMEINLYDSITLRCYCWSRKVLTLLKKQGVIFNDFSTDDELYVFDSDLEKLSLLLSLEGGFKRRLDIHGMWVKSREKKLGHEIHPFCPVILSEQVSKPTLEHVISETQYEDECELASMKQ